MDRDRQPSGDYEYDMAHDDVGSGPAPAAEGRPEERSAPPARPESSGDYGYDEAHDF